jgi:assimilatory nitrate reductase (NADH) alpha subunit apoprotein (EC 1.7.1.1)
VTSSGAQRRGQAFAPIHWSEPQALAARVGAVVNPVVDPVSGEPEFKHTPVRVEPYSVSGYGYLLLPAMPDCEDFAWWARVRLAGGWRVEFAHRERLADAGAWLRRRLGVPDGADTLEYVDPAGGVSRLAWLDDGVLRGFACLSPRPDLPPREWLSSRLGAEPLDAAQRATLLAGRPPVAGADPGPTVCACFGVGRLQILRAIRRQGLTTPEQITRVLKAGGNCGSCVPELRALLAEQAAREVVA